MGTAERREKRHNGSAQWNAYVFVELNGFTAPSFMQQKGVRQGCSLSGMVFNLSLADA